MPHGRHGAYADERPVTPRYPSTINLPALEQAREIIASYQIPGLDESTRRSAEAIAAQFQDIISRAGTLDLSRITEGLEAWIPDNLRSLDDIDHLEVVATIALNEGIPWAWVPRTSLVEQLVASPDEAARTKVLLDHLEDVLDDCLSLCSEIPHRWARECEECIRAYRSGFATAQSYAANIVDSVVMLLLGRHGRDRAKNQAQEDLDDLLLRVISESITIRPLVRAFANWWPDHGTPPPDHFARHATAHAVGHPGLFTNLNFLVAIMLATSLTAQFWEYLGASVGLLR
ncbi:MAG: hypothetical protein M0Z40_04425 [Actinomycetota bacterium]|nr:hypothetical protein [Actinomycetota bacterium]